VDKPVDKLSSYPMAQGLDALVGSAFLRRLHIPLWDTEVYVPGKDCCKIRFFSTGVGERMMLCDKVKTDCDTSQLDKTGRLQYPYKFSVLGFNIFTEEMASDDDRARMVDGGKIQFEFGGKLHDGIPLIALPRPRETLSVEDAMISIIREQNADVDLKSLANGLYEQAEKRLKEKADQLKWCYTLGKAAFKIETGENFGLVVTWDKPPEPSRPLRLTALIDGLKWSPL